MAYNPNQNFFYPPIQNGAQQPLFPQPNGNVYTINNSLEVANVPSGAGITVAICPSESMMYIKSMQNGTPMFQAYKISPYNETPKANNAAPQQDNEIVSRLTNLEKQFSLLKQKIGGKINETTSANAATDVVPEHWEV